MDPKVLHPDISQPSDELYELVSQYPDDHETRIPAASHEVFKMAATFYLTIHHRSCNKVHIPRMMNALKAYMNHDKRNAKWLLEQFTNWEILQEIFL